MKRITLFRHGKAEPFDNEKSDFDRILTPRGEKDVKTMAEKLLLNNLIPQLIIHSGAARAKQTAEIIYAESPIKPSMKEVLWLYSGFTTSQFLSILKNISDTIDTVAIVGHNPDLSGLASRLCNNFSGSLPTSGNLSIGFNIVSWNNIEAYQGEIIAFAYPKQTTQ